jgi:hypothetical protein
MILEREDADRRCASMACGDNMETAAAACAE